MAMSNALLQNYCNRLEIRRPGPHNEKGPGQMLANYASLETIALQPPLWRYCFSGGNRVTVWWQHWRTSRENGMCLMTKTASTSFYLVGCYYDDTTWVKQVKDEALGGGIFKSLLLLPEYQWICSLCYTFFSQTCTFFHSHRLEKTMLNTTTTSKVHS